jgi:hypothetical protein
MIFQTILFLSISASAAPIPDHPETKDISFTAEIISAAPYQLKFLAPMGHHFNLQAPASVELKNGSANQMGNFAKDPQKITVNFEKVATIVSGCSVKASLYVCNDANTYCRPVKQDFDCRTLKLKR